MSFMTGDDERDSPNRDFIVVGGTATIPGAGFQTAKQGDRRAPNILIFISEIAQSPFVEVCSSDEVVLLKPCERGRVSAPEAQPAICKHSLAIYHVPDELLNAPLPFGVTKIAAFFGDAPKQGKRFLELGAESSDDVPVGHQ